MKFDDKSELRQKQSKMYDVGEIKNLKMFIRHCETSTYQEYFATNRNHL
jgi:hypothetical protein